jgi:hypothetical protein
MEDRFERVCDRTRSRLDSPALRRLFGLYARPHHNRNSRPPAPEIGTGKPRYGLAWFRIRFGLLQLKAYTKGEHVLRLEATLHNTKQLRCHRGLDNFGQIITRLAGMTGRFATALDCADTSFPPDSIPGQLPLPSQTGATRTGGTGLTKPRMRAALALTAAPHRFTAAEYTANVRHLTRQDSYTTRQAAYDLRKLRGKGLAENPATPGATTSRPAQRAPSPPSSPRAITSSAPSSPWHAARAWAANQPSGPASTADTRRCASACRTFPRPRHHGQHRTDNILSIMKSQVG